MDLTLVQNWSSVRGAGDPGERVLVPGLGPLTSRQRDLLLCPGSMTLALEGFARAAVRVEVRKKGRTTLSRETGDYLGLGPAAGIACLAGTACLTGKEALEREVWLTAGSRRLVYARTLIPLECIDARLLDLLEEKSDEPMGRVLNSRNIPFAKKQLEVGTLRCPPLAADLKIDPDTTLIARRYVLFNDTGADGHSMPGVHSSMPGRHSMPGGHSMPGREPDNRAWHIRAAVFEVFSPEVVRPASQSDSIRGASGLLNTTGL